MPKSISIRDRIAQRVEIDAESGCWNWLLKTCHDGYGRITVTNRQMAVHRLAYEQFVGPIPDGLEIDHLCRNRRCCNPSHLEPVTHLENMQRSRGQTRRDGTTPLTHCGRGHELAGQDLVVNRPGRNGQCRICHNERTRRHRRRVAENLLRSA